MPTPEQLDEMRGILATGGFNPDDKKMALEVLAKAKLAGAAPPVAMNAGELEHPDEQDAAAAAAAENAVKPEEDTELADLVRGMTQGATAMFGDEITGGIAGGLDLMAGGIESGAEFGKEASQAAIPPARQQLGSATGEAAGTASRGILGMGVPSIPLYTQVRDEQRAANVEAQEDSPWMYGAGEMAGGALLGGAMPAGAVAGKAKKLLDLKRAKEIAATGAKVGAIEGGIAAAGGAEEMEDITLGRLAGGAAAGATAGAVLGPAMDVGMRAPGHLGEGVWQGLKKTNPAYGIVEEAGGRPGVWEQGGIRPHEKYGEHLEQAVKAGRTPEAVAMDSSFKGIQRNLEKLRSDTVEAVDVGKQQYFEENVDTTVSLQGLGEEFKQLMSHQQIEGQDIPGGAASKLRKFADGLKRDLDEVDMDAYGDENFAGLDKKVLELEAKLKGADETYLKANPQELEAIIEVLESAGKAADATSQGDVAKIFRRAYGKAREIRRNAFKGLDDHMERSEGQLTDLNRKLEAMGLPPKIKKVPGEEHTYVDLKGNKRVSPQGGAMFERMWNKLAGLKRGTNADSSTQHMKDLLRDDPEAMQWMHEAAATREISALRKESTPKIVGTSAGAHAYGLMPNIRTRVSRLKDLPQSDGQGIGGATSTMDWLVEEIWDKLPVTIDVVATDENFRNPVDLPAPDEDRRSRRMVGSPGL